ncbi:MAG: fructose PTS transporter subunit IIA [Anaerolineales bacterium]|nr:fructose PTS transporter subunit IIA [Anaerolineales bacterium]
MNEIITQDLIALDVALADKAAVIARIAGILEAAGRLTDREQYVRDVYEREAMVPTGIGNLIAIPHARSAGVGASALVYVRLAAPIAWNEEEQARYVFGIAVPDDNADNLHLKILANMAKKLLDDKIKLLIEESQSKQEILEALLA